MMTTEAVDNFKALMIFIEMGLWSLSSRRGQKIGQPDIHRWAQEHIEEFDLHELYIYWFFLPIFECTLCTKHHIIILS